MTTAHNTDKLSARLRAKFARYYARERLPGEALPPQINILEGFYTPAANTPARAGALDHLKHQSKGYRT